jgi:hypothetical protein
MDEKIFFNQGGISVSSQQFVVNSQTYPIQNIQSTEFRLLEPQRNLAGFFMLIGLLLLLDEGTLFVVGGFSIIIGIVIWVSAVTKYAVILFTADEEHQVLTSNDNLLIEKVIQALDTAMASNVSPIKEEVHVMRDAPHQFAFRLK